MEELLKEAYGEHFNLIKDKITNEGWLCVDYFANIYPQYSPQLFDTMIMIGKEYFRPKTIARFLENESYMRHEEARFNTSEEVFIDGKDLDREFRNECAMRAMQGMLANPSVLAEGILNKDGMQWIVSRSFIIANELLRQSKL
jgi:hypothetical protein